MKRIQFKIPILFIFTTACKIQIQASQRRYYPHTCSITVNDYGNIARLYSCSDAWRSIGRSAAPSHTLRSAGTVPCTLNFHLNFLFYSVLRIYMPLQIAIPAVTYATQKPSLYKHVFLCM